MNTYYTPWLSGDYGNNITLTNSTKIYSPTSTVGLHVAESLQVRPTLRFPFVNLVDSNLYMGFLPDNYGEHLEIQCLMIIWRVEIGFLGYTSISDRPEMAISQQLFEHDRLNMVKLPEGK